MCDAVRSSQALCLCQLVACCKQTCRSAGTASPSDSHACCPCSQNAPAYHKQAQLFLKYWICATGGDPIKFTPLGRAWNVNDGALGTTANAAFLSAVYAQTVK